MKIRRLLIATGAFFAFAAAGTAFADDAAIGVDPKYMVETEVGKYAIVIYEDTYDDASLDRDAVKNSKGDGEHFARALSQMGVSTQLLRNPTGGQIRTAIDSLINREIQQEKNNNGYPTVVVFFSGHGFRVDDQDYIAPANFDSQIGEQTALRISDIIDDISPSANLFIFSDACRTRSAGSTRDSGMPIDQYDPVPSEDATEKPSVARAPSQSPYFLADRFLVSYAATAGRPAFAAAQANAPESPYTTALAETLMEKGLDLKTALGRVSQIVHGDTQRRQKPVYDDEGAGRGSFFFNPAPSNEQKARDDWQSALQSGQKRTIEFFISENASSRYLKAALMRYAEMNAGGNP